MTPRERWLCLLNGKQPDRIPTDYQATAEVTDRLLRDLGCADTESLFRKLHIDARRHVGPKWKLPHHPDDPQADLWGVRYRMMPYPNGVYREAVYHPLAAARDPADVHHHRWPSPDDFDYSPITDALASDDGCRMISVGSYEPFLLYARMRGLEQAFEDLVIHPEIVDAALGHLFDFHYELLKRSFEAGGGKIDVTYIAEDLGGQTGPLISLQTYRRFLLPNQIRMAELARRFGIHIMYHTDGAARIFLPDLIDRVGIELLNPIQWRCPGMDRQSLVRDFGQYVIFHGSIDNQQTLSFGSEQDVIDEVRQSIEIYRGARWICAPCHNFQPITSTRKIVAMYETIHELGSLG
ncbi:uroporphyrinogen decarboxylase family protein [Fontivita pretiosa]|uniref:uroporphyrinogen decarboxylase family protein n=1 Tax=Fontivita pretiosa TaxID=2989684 RepID=UPI003D166931